MYLIVLKNTILIGLGFYLSIVCLPQMLGLDPLLSKYLFIAPATMWFTCSKNKWWANIVSILLAILISFPLIDLLLRK